MRAAIRCSFSGSNRWQILPAIGVGIAGLAAHFCMAKAFRYGDASLVIPLDFLRVPLIALVGWLFFGESVDALVFVGAVIILAGILWNLRAGSKNCTEKHRPAGRRRAVRATVTAFFAFCPFARPVDRLITIAAPHSAVQTVGEIHGIP